MRLFEAIIDANHRALGGDASAGLHPADYADSLPVAALTCIDARLNPLFPEVLGLPKEYFIWLRNAGNIITGPLSSTMRSLALACAVKGGKEIAIIGHNDCLVCKTSTSQLTDALGALGVNRAGLPPNLTEFFGLFASERQNVLKAVEYVRHSPIIGPKVPVHGLLVDIETGKLEWVSNGYQALEMAGASKSEGAQLLQTAENALGALTGFNIGEMKFPETKIGELATEAKDWFAQKIGEPIQGAGPAQKPEPPPIAPPVARPPAPPAPPPIRMAPPGPKKIPLPPPVRPGFNYPKGRKF